MYLEKYGYGNFIDELEKRGYWKKLKTQSFTRYENIGEGEVIGRFKPVEALVFVYRKN